MEDSKLEYKTIAQIGELNDQQRMQYLLNQWSLSSPVIEGKPELRNDLWWLTEVTRLDGNVLEFPFSDLPDWRKSLQRGVFIGPKLPVAIRVRPLLRKRWSNDQCSSAARSITVTGPFQARIG